MTTFTLSLRFRDCVYPLKVQGEIRDAWSASTMRVPVVGETSPRRITCQFPSHFSHWKCPTCQILRWNEKFCLVKFHHVLLKHRLLDASIPWSLEQPGLLSRVFALWVMSFWLREPVSGLCGSSATSPAECGSDLAWVTSQWLFHPGPTKPSAHD